jgi:glucose/arabinose dehydrogenase
MKSTCFVMALIVLAAGMAIPQPGRISAAAVQEPPDVAVELQPVLTGLSEPILLTNARDGSGRLFIIEQPGRIRVLQRDATSTTLFLNITSRVLAGGERGLLGLTFHPRFENNGRFFVNYTRRPDGATVIAEYRVSPSDPNAGDPSSERVLLTIGQPFANHNGGMIEFGHDGFLHIAMGDGGSANDPGNRAQNINVLLGKILRIDVDVSGSAPYSSPPNNPFAGSIPGRDEIFAVGFRNPWRFSFDRMTGELYAGDVGQNAREEIDIVTLGGNYGWRVFEGTRCTNNDPGLCNLGAFTSPITQYQNGTGGRCSVTGGYVYRGSRRSLPVGSYVFGDFCTGEIFLFDRGVQSLLMDTGLNISSFGEDEAGEIYVVGIGGTVHRLVDPQAPAPPPPPPPTFRIDSVEIRRRSTGELLNPVTVQNNGKKYDIIVSGQDFPPGSRVVINNREMKTREGQPASQMLLARLRRGTLIEAAPLVVVLRTPDGTLSNPLTVLVVDE